MVLQQDWHLNPILLIMIFFPIFCMSTANVIFNKSFTTVKVVNNLNLKRFKVINFAQVYMFRQKY